MEALVAENELAELTATAAATLVRALVSDGWELARSSMAALWKRAHPERATMIEAELAETREVALDARRSADPDAEEQLITEWQSRLRRLVVADPALAEDLRRLLTQWLRSESEGEDGERGPRVHVEQHVRASDHSRVVIAGRDAHVREPYVEHSTEQRGNHDPGLADGPSSS
jgi:hypothetical protein